MISKLKATLPFTLVLALYLVLYSLSHIPLSKDLSLALSIDLLIVIPLVYLFLIRKSSIPKITVVPIVFLGLIYGFYLLKPEDQTYLLLFKAWVLPFIELGVISFLIFKVHRLIKSFNSQNQADVDFYDALKISAYDLFPPALAQALAMEVSVFYYGFVSWRKRELKRCEFSYHKENGVIGLLSIILVIIGIETYALHLFLVEWNLYLAWTLSFLSIYTGLQIVGFMRSLSKRPYKLQDGVLELNYGFMCKTTIKLEEIERIEYSSKDIDEMADSRKLSLLGNLESHNTIIYLKSPHDWYGLYGIKRPYQILALQVDDKAAFQKLIG